MAFTKIFEGQTFPPGTVFPPHCYFKNCTFQAQCKIDAGSLIDGCNFVKCCPPKFQNPNSEVKASRLINSSLEYVTIDKDTFVHNNKDTGNRVINQGWTRDGVVQGNTEKLDNQGIPGNCCQNGVDIAPVASGKPMVKPVAKPLCESSQCVPDGFNKNT